MMREFSSRDDALAQFLQQKRNLNENVVDHIENKTPPRLTSETSASIDDFVSMASMVVSKAARKLKVEFKPDEGARPKVDQMEKIDHPYITFKICRCEPTKEIKPRIREDGIPKNPDGSDPEELLTPLDIWGQLFRYTLQFDIFADGYKQATEVMNIFEDIIFSYTAYFKRRGVKDIRFISRMTDSNLDIYRQKCSIRSLRYEVDIEKLFTRYETTIGDIIVR